MLSCGVARPASRALAHSSASTSKGRSWFTSPPFDRTVGSASQLVASGAMNSKPAADSSSACALSTREASGQSAMAPTVSLARFL